MIGGTPIFDQLARDAIEDLGLTISESERAAGSSGRDDAVSDEAVMPS
jgi:hypothetical protein